MTVKRNYFYVWNTFRVTSKLDSHRDEFFKCFKEEYKASMPFFAKNEKHQHESRSSDTFYLEKI